MTGSSADVVPLAFCVELPLLWSGVSALKTENLMVFSRCSGDSMLFTEMKDSHETHGNDCQRLGESGMIATSAEHSFAKMVAKGTGAKNDANIFQMTSETSFMCRIIADLPKYRYCTVMSRKQN